ncbi:hypothetical protein [Planococcus chinensis]|uniref:Uncharacterized protein n=1 Tax=Planococcus chinensis TaxID=272917 RepID=A0ABW4QEK4_9BACL
MKNKLLIWFLVISLMASGWFLYKWQKAENIYEGKLASNLEQTTRNAGFMMGVSPAQISADPTYIRLKLEALSDAFAAASDMSHPEMDVSIEETDFKYLWGAHLILERNYLPIIEKLQYTDQPLSKDDEEKLMQLKTSLFESGLIGEYEHPSATDSYMRAVKEFLRLEGALSDVGNLKL